jgi:hypothetical protein
MKNSASKLLMIAAVAALTCILSTQVQAVPISGTIDFNGGATTDTGNLATANAFTSFSGVTVSTAVAPTGDYSSVPGGTSVPTMNGFTFDPPGGVPLLWSFVSGGITYSFSLTSASVVAQSSGFLNVAGNGIASITGFDPTPGTFSITLTGSSGAPSKVFSFTAETAVPEGGATVALLGVGLVALAVARRKLVRS